MPPVILLCMICKEYSPVLPWCLSQKRRWLIIHKTYFFLTHCLPSKRRSYRRAVYHQNALAELTLKRDRNCTNALKYCSWKHCYMFPMWLSHSHPLVLHHRSGSNEASWLHNTLSWVHTLHQQRLHRNLHQEMFYFYLFLVRELPRYNWCQRDSFQLLTSV